MLPSVRLHALYAYSVSLGMEPLVEVHTPDEMRIALELGAKVIGVNNRNLHDFNVDMGTTSRLADMARGDVVLCALSGITGPEDVRGYAKQGVGAVLVGEALMRAKDPRVFIHTLLDWPLPEEEGDDAQVLVKICGNKSVEDALVAAEAGADLLGLIFVPSSKRYVSVDVAKSIANAVRDLRSSPNAPPSADVEVEAKPEAGVEKEAEAEAEKETEEEAEKDKETKTEPVVTQPQKPSEPHPTANATWFATHARQLERTLAHRRPLLVGVFQNAPLSVVQDTVARVGLDLVQLHGSEPVEWARFISVPVVRVFHVRAGDSKGGESGIGAKTVPEGLRELTRPGLHALALLDAQRADGLSGGSGKTVDWAQARAVVDAGELGGERVGTKEKEVHPENENGGEKTRGKDGDGQGGDTGADVKVAADTPRHARMPLILAGGLTPANVAEAIANVRPWAVDVCGGVERADGAGKDVDKVRAFVRAVKGEVAVPPAPESVTVEAN